MLKLKLQYFGHLMWRADSLEKDPDAGQDWRQEEKGMTEGEMDGWHHRFDGHEFEQALEVDDGQGSLVCCSPWGHKESNTAEQLNWTEGAHFFEYFIDDFFLSELIKDNSLYQGDFCCCLVTKSSPALLRPHRL